MWFSRKLARRCGRGSTQALVALCLTALVAIALGSPAAAPASDSPVDTSVFQPPNVVAQFNALSERADALGFGIGSSADPTLCKHYQGVARSQGPGEPFLFVTHSRNATDTACSGEDNPGELLAVDMASRGDDGERLRSNRLMPDTDTIKSPPPASDTTTKVVRFDGTDCNQADGISGWPGYHHPGGMQLVGDILAVPLEKPIAGKGCPKSMIAFLDVSNPESPVLRSWKALSFEQSGVVAVTRQPNGHFLMIVTGGNNAVLHVFRSQGADLGASDLAWDLVFDYDEDAIEDDIAPRDWPTSASYQTLNFVREASTNQLFLFAARGDDYIVNDGNDLLDLYKVIEQDNDHFSLEFVGQRHLYTVPTAESCGASACEGDEEIANFQAASGISVSPSGNILLYATEHDNDGPEVGGVKTVKAGEWRNQEIVRPGSPTLLPSADAGGSYTVDEGASVQLNGSAAPPLTRAWVELFAYEDFKSRSVIIDYPDRDLDDFDNFNKIEAESGDLNGFSDDASAMRWFAPKGCTFNLNEHHVGAQNFPGASRTVVGDGKVHNETDLGAVDGEISSITWSPNCETTYNSPATAAWDLDGDKTFETTGAAPTFSTQTLDGPTTRTVTLRATQAASDVPGFGSATVQVNNVAPSLSAVGATDSLGNPLGTVTPFVLAGQPVKVSGSFTDPGVADTHVASVTWGDGVVDQGAAKGTFSYTHIYAQPGSYQAVATVTDDDGGTATESIAIDVVDPAAAIEGVGDQLEDLLDDGYSPAVNEAIAQALQELLGSAGGQAAGGALDLLETGDTEAAMVKLIAAVEALQQAEAAGGPNLDAAMDLLGLIGQALAQAAYADAQAAVAPASPGEQHQLDKIANLITVGKAALIGGDDVGALEDFWTAVQKAEALVG
jgi:PKD domain